MDTQTEREQTQLTLTREILADPTSTALLLAGPTAMDLWPGLRRIGNKDGRIHAETKVARETHEVLIKAHPPRRLPTSFVTTFQGVAGDEQVDGNLSLGFSEKNGEMVTVANLTITTSPERAKALKKLAEKFLENLGEAAEKRATAA